MSPRAMFGVVVSLLVSLTSDGWSQAATGTITGIVREAASQSPVSAAQVFISELQIGTLAQASGRYLLINVPAGTHSMRVERIGYRAEVQQVTVRAGQSTEVNFALTEDALALDEIVVTGTAGQARRREVGNVIAQIRPTDIPEPVTNIGTLLQSRMAGVVVREGSGQAGSAPDIRIRGNISVTMSNNPLIYVDGVRTKSDYYQAEGQGDIQSPLADINPEDIERIEIVKGPAATTLYGTEAAAGVIQIFTKRGGSVGAPIWTAETRQGFSYFRPFGPDTDNVSEDWPHGARYMYMDPVFRKGYRQTYNLSVRGGSAERLGYYLSAGWDDNESAVINDWEHQLSLRGNTQFRPFESLLLQFNNSFTTTDLRQVYQGNSGSGLVMTAYRGDDSYIGEKSAKTLRILTEQRNFVYIDRFVSGLTMNYTPTQNFTHRLTLGHDYSERAVDRIFDYCWRCQFGRPNDFGSVSRAADQQRLWSFDYVGNLGFDLMSGVRSTLSYGAQGVQEEIERVSVTGSDLPGPGDYDIDAAARISSAGQTKQRVITGGLFVQDQLGYRDRYFLTLGVRVDGNSAFGRSFGLQPYPKASLSYVISDEGFWPEFLGTMKLRAAYGWAGRAPGTFDAVRTWGTPGWGATEPAFTPSNLGNPDLGPERSREIELGFDASALNDRLTVELTYYDRLTTDALFNVRNPSTLGGWGSQRFNVGELKNWGWEVALNGTLLDARWVRWDVGGNATITDSEILSLGGEPPFSSGGAWTDVGLQVGVRRGNRIMNWYEMAEAVIENNAIYGPGWPTKTLNLNTSFTLPGGVVLSGRGEYNGGHWIPNGAESLALQRTIPVPKCYDAYRKVNRSWVVGAPGRESEPPPLPSTAAARDAAGLLAWERAHCFGMSSSNLNIVPANYFELRDVTLSIPLSSLLPSLTRWSQRTDLTISARNVWYVKNSRLVSGHPEQSTRGTDVSLAQGTNETLPPQSYVTISLRAIF